MPREQRVLVFSQAELIEAVEAFAARASRLALPGRIAEVRPSSAGNEVAAEASIPGKPPVAVGPSDLVSALVFYCISQGIPLPSHAEKTLRINGDGIEMMLGKGLASDRQFTAAARDGAAAR